MSALKPQLSHLHLSSLLPSCILLSQLAAAATSVGRARRDSLVLYLVRCGTAGGFLLLLLLVLTSAFHSLRRSHHAATDVLQSCRCCCLRLFSAPSPRARLGHGRGQTVQVSSSGPPLARSCCPHPLACLPLLRRCSLPDPLPLLSACICSLVSDGSSLSLLISGPVIGCVSWTLTWPSSTTRRSRTAGWQSRCCEREQTWQQTRCWRSCATSRSSSARSGRSGQTR